MILECFCCSYILYSVWITLANYGVLWYNSAILPLDDKYS